MMPDQNDLNQSKSFYHRQIQIRNFADIKSCTTIILQICRTTMYFF